eukprot:5425955-Amphidinium_carterae.1
MMILSKTFLSRCRTGVNLVKLVVQKAFPDSSIVAMMCSPLLLTVIGLMSAKTTSPKLQTAEVYGTPQPL